MHVHLYDEKFCGLRFDLFKFALWTEQFSMSLTPPYILVYMIGKKLLTFNVLLNAKSRCIRRAFVCAFSWLCRRVTLTNPLIHSTCGQRCSLCVALRCRTSCIILCEILLSLRHWRIRHAGFEMLISVSCSAILWSYDNAQFCSE